MEVKADSFKVLSPATGKTCICAFLWTYFGYPNSDYEGINVERMRNLNGHIMARDEAEHGGVPEVDHVCGVPDSGIAHAIGYSNECRQDYGRVFVKYTPTWPRSFMPMSHEERSRVAKMKQVPVTPLIKDMKLLLVDDSIVRGTQLRETVDFLYEHGAKEVHIGRRSLNSKEKKARSISTSTVMAEQKEAKPSARPSAKNSDSIPWAIRISTAFWKRSDWIKTQFAHTAGTERNNT